MLQEKLPLTKPWTFREDGVAGLSRVRLPETSGGPASVRISGLQVDVGGQSGAGLESRQAARQGRPEGNETQLFRVILPPAEENKKWFGTFRRSEPGRSNRSRGSGGSHGGGEAEVLAADQEEVRLVSVEPVLRRR